MMLQWWQRSWSRQWQVRCRRVPTATRLFASSGESVHHDLQPESQEHHHDGSSTGSFYFNTGVWTDGLVAFMVREPVSDTSDFLYWVVFDGPVGAIWFVNLNTVLDDNCWCASPTGSGSNCRPR